MNRGTTRHPEYYCDKCGIKITRGRRHTYYKYNSKACAATKDFDLCTSCNNRLRNWLKEKEIPTTEEILSKFPVYVEVGEEDE